MNMFIGLDVSLASTAICVLDAHGKAVRETTVASEPETLAGFLRGLSARAFCAAFPAA